MGRVRMSQVMQADVGEIRARNKVLECFRYVLRRQWPASLVSEDQSSEEVYVVSVNVVVEATSEDEASMMVERALAGRLDNDIVDVFAEDPDQR